MDAVTALTTTITTRGHVAGSVKTYRTKSGKQYLFMACGNVGCHVEVEYSVDRSKVTKSTTPKFQCNYTEASS